MYTKRDIILAARLLFSEHGYHGTSVREIADALHIRQGSLYSHIISKEELLWEIVSYAADVFLAQAKLIPWNAPIELQMIALIQGHLEVLVREPQSTIILFHEWRFLEPVWREQIQLKCRAYTASFQRIIGEGAQQGKFRISDARITALFVLSALNWSYHWLRFEDDLSRERVISQYVLFTMRLLKG